MFSDLLESVYFFVDYLYFMPQNQIPIYVYFNLILIIKVYNSEMIKEKIIYPANKKKLKVETKWRKKRNILDIRL